ncbi:MAG: peptidoglycan editing factor PgeF [Trueperaceae bacterium]
MSWYVYLLSCSDGSLYTGITRDPAQRESAHNSGEGAAYTRSRLPARLAYVEPAADRSAALKRELQIKKLSRHGKLELIATRSQVRYDAPVLSIAGFGAPHGFSSRSGGVSGGPYASLNLGANTGDDPERIERNRAIFRDWFAADEAQLCLLDQVHGDRVAVAQSSAIVEADAQISDDPMKLLVIASADCLPLLFFDSVHGAVGAAHCGWRGTLERLAAKTVEALATQFGSKPEDLRVALGPGICQGCYEVSSDLVARFEGAGFPHEIASRGVEGSWRLDLAGANLHALCEAGVPRASIDLAGRVQGPHEDRSAVPACTSCEPERFFSHRRDRGVTGRHWAAVRAVSVAGKG